MFITQPFLRCTAFTGLLIAVSCSSKKQTKDEAIAVVMEIASSYKYDLGQETYTVFNMQKSDTTIHFQLTDQEKKQIVDKYYSLHLNELAGKQEIEDSCFMSPKLYTTLRVKTRKQEQEIILDDGCEKHSEAFAGKAKRVSAFLQLVISILKTKPEINAAPPSDIVYM